MSTSVAVIALTYDGTDIQLADLSILLQIVRGLNEPPSVRGIDTTVPALAGRVEGNRINDIVDIELRGHITFDPAQTVLANARLSFRAKAKAMRLLFASNRARANLVATLEDGSTATISARPMPGVIWTETIPGEYAEVSYPLEGYGDWVIT